MTVPDERAAARATVADHPPTNEELQKIWNRVVGRRAFLVQAGLASAAATGAAAVAAPEAFGKAHVADVGPTAGDFAILRWLATAELIESDLWEQYAAFGGVNGANPAYIAALQNLDGDMPQYISDNTDDEETHAAFINAYLMSKGQAPVNLDKFRNLAPSPATGGGSTKRLTQLMDLNVDTSWYTRYRSTTNPDLGATFAQAVRIEHEPGVPLNDTETPPGNSQPVPPVTPSQRRMQAIANTAGFHFAMIEQGGSSLYTTMAQKVTSLEVLRIVVAIGGTEVNHFAIWHDKAGNAVSQPLAGVVDPKTGLKFPDFNALNSELKQTNLIMPEPCEFIPGLPDCSIIRPSGVLHGGALAAFHALATNNLFKGQPGSFFRLLKQTAAKADNAHRGVI